VQTLRRGSGACVYVWLSTSNAEMCPSLMLRCLKELLHAVETGAVVYALMAVNYKAALLRTVKQARHYYI